MMIVIVRLDGIGWMGWVVVEGVVKEKKKKRIMMVIIDCSGVLLDLRALVAVVDDGDECDDGVVFLALVLVVVVVSGSDCGGKD